MGKYDALDPRHFHGQRNMTEGLRSGSDKILTELLNLKQGKPFVSAEQTGTGAEQSLAHGLEKAPSAVLAIITDNTATPGFTVAEGTHTATETKFTVTADVKYKVLALP